MNYYVILSYLFMVGFLYEDSQKNLSKIDYLLLTVLFLISPIATPVITGYLFNDIRIFIK